MRWLASCLGKSNLASKNKIKFKTRIHPITRIKTKMALSFDMGEAQANQFGVMVIGGFNIKILCKTP